MSQPVAGTGSKAGAQAPAPRSLAQRDDMAPRVRRLLEGVLALCSSGLERAVVETLNEFEMQLFKIAEQGRSNESQYRSFETLREIKRGRADVAPRYMLAIEDALARFDQHEPAGAEKPPKAAGAAKSELALVETSELEETLALQEFAAKTEIRQAQPLFALGHRFGVLAGAPMFDAETLPIGPTQLGRALREASAGLAIDPAHRTLLFRTFDRMTMKAIGTFYEAVNAYLIDQRILRHLRVQAPLPKPAARSEPAPPPPETPASAAPAPAPAPQSAPAQPPPGMARMRGEVPNWSGGAAPGLPGDDRDSELFTTLRELLAGRRHALGIGDAAAGANAYVPSGDDMQAVLGTLQAKPPAPMMLGGKPVQRSVAHLKQDLLAHLRQIAPDGRTPNLAPEDSDTIDLVGMLFDYIGKNVRPNGSTQSLMTKLQVPLLRVALRDKSFFTRRTHPARQLLNALAETGTHWLDESEGPADRDLVDKMQMVVDRVMQDFDGDLGLIEDMLGGLTQHMHTLARKAEVTERRHVDAAKGREKLGVAREQASSAIAARIAQAKPGKLVRTILEQAWTDVLALTLLRNGEQSDIYRKRLAVADRLLAADVGRGPNPKAPPQELREEIETGLDQVGFHREDIQAVVKRLFVPGQAANEDEPASNTEIAIKLKSKVQLGGAHAAPATHPEKPHIKPDSEAARMLERLKGLPFGTWFEFKTNQQGDKVRRKLAWFSTLTGRCLFVNQRGARADERTLEHLALDIVSGQANIVEPETESLVDRAWKAIVSSLRQLVGRDPEPQPA